MDTQNLYWYIVFQHLVNTSKIYIYMYMTEMTIHNINFKLILIIEIKGSFIMKFVHKICDIAPMC